MYDVRVNQEIEIYIGELNMTTQVGDSADMAKVSAKFSLRLQCVLIRTGGAIDGWLVCIARLEQIRESIKNQVGFFS